MRHLQRRTTWVPLGWALIGCAPVTAPPLFNRDVRDDVVKTPPPVVSALRRDDTVDYARQRLAGAPLVARGVEFSGDAVGFVRAAFWQAGIDLVDAGVAADPSADSMSILYRSVAKRGWLHNQTPRKGDLIFFDADDRGAALAPAQVAIVEGIADDGTLTVVGAFAAGPARIHVNLRQPETTTTADGAKLNDLLNGGRPVAAGALFRAFADPFRGGP
ncbi:MAG: CHAP domain-containing protein [Deltaproteobacteria bacterium]|nr:CHAP domain-containing protein [Deltaproteobacteria bacterium]